MTPRKCLMMPRSVGVELHAMPISLRRGPSASSDGDSKNRYGEITSECEFCGTVSSASIFSKSSPGFRMIVRYSA
ncbi:hypothetical protein SABIM44S_00704 [Streptomyces abikoensis]